MSIPPKNPPPIEADIEVKVSVFTTIIGLNHHKQKHVLIMDVHGFYLVHIYPKYYIALLVKYSEINTYIHCTHYSIYIECEKISW
jgi:hypothetical protein